MLPMWVCNKHIAYYITAVPPHLPALWFAMCALRLAKCTESKPLPSCHRLKLAVKLVWTSNFLHHPSSSHKLKSVNFQLFGVGGILPE